MKKKLIQIISFEIQKSFTSEDITINFLSKPDSLDMYHINVIDLNNSEIWKNKGMEPNNLILINDLKNLTEMVNNSKETKVIYIYPQDLIFRYFYLNGKLNSSINLRNIIQNVEINIVNKHLNLPFNLNYERTTTQISKFNIKSDFYFNTEKGILTSSVLSFKATTINYRNAVITTLFIRNSEELMEFIKKLNLLEFKITTPPWVDKIEFFNDKILNFSIQSNYNIIEKASEEIKLLNINLEKNNIYKSILYSTGNELTQVVFDILEQIFRYDLKEFVDTKKEDFLIELDGINFLGEIKGVSTNVKSEYISQLDVHFQSFLEGRDESESKNINKSLLIICHQRNKDIENREKIHENQLLLAKRNESLIVDTITLLNIYECFLLNKISTEEIIELFINSSGLLQFTKIE